MRLVTVISLSVVLAASLVASNQALAQPSLDWAIKPLTDVAGNAERGKAIVLNRQQALCVLCHAGLNPPGQLPADLAPGFEGVGKRLSETELRARMMNSRRINPESIMPAYFMNDPSLVSRVSRAFQGKSILTAQDIEDVVAFLRTQ